MNAPVKDCPQSEYPIRDRAYTPEQKSCCITFTDVGDFRALDGAREWCRVRGISYGSLQGDAPVGLMIGDCYIAKWRNLDVTERHQLDGVLTGEKRNGPVFIVPLSDAMKRLVEVQP